MTPPPPLRSALRDELRLRAKLAEAVPLGDPAHCILFELALARIDHRYINIKWACSATEVPHTTALRYIALLIDAGLARREPDPGDHRSSRLSITDDGFARIEALFAPPLTAVLRKVA